MARPILYFRLGFVQSSPLIRFVLLLALSTFLSHKTFGQENNSAPPVPSNTFRADVLTPLEGLDFRPWLSGFVEKIRGNWAAKMREQGIWEDKGIVFIRVTLHHDGQFVNGYPQVEISSGIPKLDDASLSTVAAATVFEPLPDKFQNGKIEVRLTFRYAYLPDAPFKDLYTAAQKAATSQEYSAAAQLLEVLLDKDPDYTNGWNYLGWIYNRLGKYDKAIPALKKAIQEYPRDPLAYNNLGQAYAGLKQYDDAILQYQKQLDINKNDQFAHVNLGRAYLEKERYSKAIDELELGAAATPKNAGLFFTLGRAYVKAGQPEKAKEAFKKSVELEPLPMRMNNVAYQMALSDLDLPAARSYAESGIAALVLKMRDTSIDQLGTEDFRLTSWISNLWDTLGWIAFEQGKVAEARKYVRSSWQLHAVGEVGYHLGRIEEAEGHKEAAIQAYELSLAAPQPYADARIRLEKLLGGGLEIDKRIEEARPQLTEIRTVSIPNPHQADGVAEFWILFAPGPKMLGVKFITGDEALRPLGKDLEAASYPNVFPEATEIRLLRRGRLTCSPAPQNSCRLLFASAESVRNLD